MKNSKIIEDDHFINFRFSLESRPSWRNYGTGLGFLNIEFHKKAKWIQLTMVEQAEPEQGKKIVEKTTMLTLKKENAAQLAKYFQNMKF